MLIRKSLARLAKPTAIAVVLALVPRLACGEWMTVTASPDTFASGQDVSSVFPGVALDAVHLTSWGSPTGGAVYAYHVDGAAPGDNVFAAGSDGERFYNVTGAGNFERTEFRLIFDSPTDYVSVDFFGTNIRNVRMICTDPVGYVFYPGAGTDGRATVSSSSRNIRVIEFYPRGDVTGGSDLAAAYFDNLRYNAEVQTVVPAPTTLVGLVSMGLVGALSYVWRRRRGR